MPSKAVIGLGHGDEGKGLVTETLSYPDPGNTIVIRFSGGQQAGHKVCHHDIEHIFSNFGSGTLLGCPTYWSEFCTFSPINFIRELEVLRSKSIEPQFYIHPDCPVTTPYDVLANRQQQEMQHGTCGSGIFRTKKRHFTDKLTLTVADLADLKDLEQHRDYHKMHRVREEDLFFESAAAVREFVQLSHTVPGYQYKIFEGSQGLMLHEFIGTMPHCTPSDVTPRNAMKLSPLDEIWLVTRCYGTRHGNGPLCNSNLPAPVLKNTEKETNQLNPFQGEFRTAILDLDALIHAKREGIDKLVSQGTRTHLVVTCVDQLDDFFLTENGKLLRWDNYTDMVKYIGQKLNINGDTLYNCMPETGFIWKV